MDRRGYPVKDTQAEIERLRNQLYSAERHYIRLQIRNGELQDENDDLRARVEAALQQLEQMTLYCYFRPVGQPTIDDLRDVLRGEGGE